MTQCIELILRWERDLAPKSQLSSQSPPAYIQTQGSFFPMYIIYLIFIWPLPLYHKVFLTSFLMVSLILSTLNTLMYWQTITSHCVSPFADCCWTKKKSICKLLKNSTDDFPYNLFTSYSSIQGHSFIPFLFWSCNPSIINYAEAEISKSAVLVMPTNIYLLILSMLISETLNFSKKSRNIKYLIFLVKWQVLTWYSKT